MCQYTLLRCMRQYNLDAFQDDTILMHFNSFTKTLPLSSTHINQNWTGLPTKPSSIHCPAPLSPSAALFPPNGKRKSTMPTQAHMQYTKSTFPNHFSYTKHTSHHLLLKLQLNPFLGLCGWFARSARVGSKLRTFRRASPVPIERMTSLQRRPPVVHKSPRSTSCGQMMGRWPTRPPMDFLTCHHPACSCRGMRRVIIHLQSIFPMKCVVSE